MRSALGPIARWFGARVAISRIVEAGTRARRLFALSPVLLLAACGGIIPPGQIVPRPPITRPVPPIVQPNALAAGIAPGPAIASLGIGSSAASAALRSFRESCPRLVRRTDNSGLTLGADWKPACEAASAWPTGREPDFFAEHFETAQIADGSSYVTGYYEPEIAGVRQRQPGFDVPIYAAPPDLVRARPGDAAPNADGSMPLGRYDSSGRFVAYYDRGQIEDGALAGRGLEIAWAADPVEAFFLQVQGSGRLRAPDGSVIRVGFAAQNGWPYSGIGGLLRDRGVVGDGPGQYPGSMQGIMRYVRDHPAQGRALMRENRSFVFFREVVGGDPGGPAGALGVTVRPRVSLAADPAFVPLGAPVWLAVDRGDVSGLWIAQDTGGAIKGANRFDSFWGTGSQARLTAGGMATRGRALVLLPRGTLRRLGAR